MRRESWGGVAGLVLAVATHACGGSEPVTAPGPAGAAGGAAAGPGGTGAAGGGEASDGSGCPGTAGPKMVNTGLFCIDSTEVTQAQYRQFLDAKPALDGQPPECSWNKTYAPPAPGGWCPFGAWVPDQHPNYPAVCVDWCDAYAYCRWAGKRLCGKVGGGPNPYSRADDPTSSQWFRACTSAGANPYTYGTSYDPMACNGDQRAGCAKNGYCHALDVGSLATCQSSVSGFAGVFDLNGNVEEWEDSCNGSLGQADLCLPRGGSAGSDVQSLLCGTNGEHGNTRNYLAEGIGFRCCGP
jgi:formylglycine-generating enzyme required for sulfatase activity